MAAPFMAAAHTRIAPLLPVRPVGLLSSRPTHATPSILPPKPANHESRLSFEVPVLPASGVIPGSCVASAAAVPSATTRLKA